MRSVALLLVLALDVPLWHIAAQPVVFTPGRRLSGTLPSPPPPTVVGWIEEMVEVEVNARGVVDRATLLRASSRGPSLSVPAVAGWRFESATEKTGPVATRVLVAAVFRPPALYDGPTLGARAIDIAAPSSEVPFPEMIVRPQHPPQTVGDAVLLVEAAIDVDGRVTDVKVVKGAAGFDAAAAAAARRWTFRPARHNGEPVTAFAYLIFGFRQPTSGRQP